MSMAIRLTVPDGLRDLMKDLTKEILKEKPADIYNFAEKYFQSRLLGKENCTVNSHEKTRGKYDFSYIRDSRHQVPIGLVYSIIPEVLTNLIRDLIKAVLREKPQNLCDFALEYFLHVKAFTYNEAKTISKEIDYAAYENYFINKERSLFTPYLNCTCGRTLNEAYKSSLETWCLTQNTKILNIDSPFQSSKLLDDNATTEPYASFANYGKTNAGTVIHQHTDPKDTKLQKIPQQQINHNERGKNSDDACSMMTSGVLILATESGREVSELKTDESIFSTTFAESGENENHRQSETSSRNAKDTTETNISKTNGFERGNVKMNEKAALDLIYSSSESACLVKTCMQDYDEKISNRGSDNLFKPCRFEESSICNESSFQDIKSESQKDGIFSYTEKLSSDHEVKAENKIIKTGTENNKNGNTHGYISGECKTSSFEINKEISISTCASLEEMSQINVTLNDIKSEVQPSKRHVKNEETETKQHAPEIFFDSSQDLNSNHFKSINNENPEIHKDDYRLENSIKTKFDKSFVKKNVNINLSNGHGEIQSESNIGSGNFYITKYKGTESKQSIETNAHDLKNKQKDIHIDVLRRNVDLQLKQMTPKEIDQKNLGTDSNDLEKINDYSLSIKSFNETDLREVKNTDQRVEDIILQGSLSNTLKANGLNVNKSFLLDNTYYKSGKISREEPKINEVTSSQFGMPSNKLSANIKRESNGKIDAADETGCNIKKYIQKEPLNPADKLQPTSMLPVYLTEANKQAGLTVIRDITKLLEENIEGCLDKDLNKDTNFDKNSQSEYHGNIIRSGDIFNKSLNNNYPNESLQQTNKKDQCDKPEYKSQDESFGINCGEAKENALINKDTNEEQNLVLEITQTDIKDSENNDQDFQKTRNVPHVFKKSDDFKLEERNKNITSKTNTISLNDELVENVCLNKIDSNTVNNHSIILNSVESINNDRINIYSPTDSKKISTDDAISDESKFKFINESKDGIKNLSDPIVEDKDTKLKLKSKMSQQEANKICKNDQQCNKEVMNSINFNSSIENTPENTNQKNNVHHEIKCVSSEKTFDKTGEVAKNVSDNDITVKCEANITENKVTNKNTQEMQIVEYKQKNYTNLIQAVQDNERGNNLIGKDKVKLNNQHLRDSIDQKIDIEEAHKVQQSFETNAYSSNHIKNQKTIQRQSNISEQSASGERFKNDIGELSYSTNKVINNGTVLEEASNIIRNHVTETEILSLNKVYSKNLQTHLKESMIGESQEEMIINVDKSAMITTKKYNEQSLTSVNYKSNKFETQSETENFDTLFGRTNKSQIKSKNDVTATHEQLMLSLEQNPNFIGTKDDNHFANALSDSKESNRSEANDVSILKDSKLSVPKQHVLDTSLIQQGSTNMSYKNQQELDINETKSEKNITKRENLQKIEIKGAVSKNVNTEQNTNEPNQKQLLCLDNFNELDVLNEDIKSTIKVLSKFNHVIPAISNREGDSVPLDENIESTVPNKREKAKDQIFNGNTNPEIIFTHNTNQDNKIVYLNGDQCNTKTNEECKTERECINVGPGSKGEENKENEINRFDKGYIQDPYHDFANAIAFKNILDPLNNCNNLQKDFIVHDEKRQSECPVDQETDNKQILKKFLVSSENKIKKKSDSADIHQELLDEYKVQKSSSDEFNNKKIDIGELSHYNEQVGQIAANPDNKDKRISISIAQPVDQQLNKNSEKFIDRNYANDLIVKSESRSNENASEFSDGEAFKKNNFFNEITSTSPSQQSPNINITTINECDFIDAPLTQETENKINATGLKYHKEEVEAALKLNVENQNEDGMGSLEEYKNIDSAVNLCGKDNDKERENEETNNTKIKNNKKSHVLLATKDTEAIHSQQNAISALNVHQNKVFNIIYTHDYLSKESALRLSRIDIGLKTKNQVYFETNIGNQNLTIDRIRSFNECLNTKIFNQIFAETYLRSFWKEYLMKNNVPINQYYIENEPKQHKMQQRNSNKASNNTTLKVHDYTNKEQVIANAEKTHSISSPYGNYKISGQSNNITLHKNIAQTSRFFHGVPNAEKRNIYKETTSFVIPLGKSKEPSSATNSTLNIEKRTDKYETNDLIKLNLIGSVGTNHVRNINESKYETHNFFLDITNHKDTNIMGEYSTASEPMLQTVIELSERETPTLIDYSKSVNDEITVNLEKINDSVRTSCIVSSNIDSSLGSTELLATLEEESCPPVGRNTWKNEIIIDNLGSLNSSGSKETNNNFENEVLQRKEDSNSHAKLLVQSSNDSKNLTISNTQTNEVECKNNQVIINLHNSKKETNGSETKIEYSKAIHDYSCGHIYFENVRSVDNNDIKSSQSIKDQMAGKIQHFFKEFMKQKSISKTMKNEIKKSSWFIGDEAIVANKQLRLTILEIPFEETKAYFKMTARPHLVDSRNSFEIIDVNNSNKSLTTPVSNESENTINVENDHLINIVEDTVTSIESEVNNKKGIEHTNHCRQIPLHSKRNTCDSIFPKECICITKCTPDDEEISTNASASSGSSSISEVDDTEDSLSTRTVKLHKPHIAIMKMQKRQENTTKVLLSDKSKDYSFDEPLVAAIDSLDTDEEGIVVGKLQRENSRSASDVIIDLNNKNNSNLLHSCDINEASPVKGSLKRNSDPKLLLKSVTIDKSIKYIEPPDYEVNSGNLCLDEETAKNIRGRTIDYSISESDSNGFGKKSNNRESYNFESKDAKYNDFNISTGFVDNFNCSTETESTIVLAATKIQASVRGYLMRKRLERTSVKNDCKSTFYDKFSDASFRKAAISESYENLITETEIYSQYKTKLAEGSQEENQHSLSNFAAGMDYNLAQKQHVVPLNNSTQYKCNSTEVKNNAKTPIIDKNNYFTKQHCGENIFLNTMQEDKTAAEIRLKKTENNKIKWFIMRQNSMPVQIDSEVLRVMPKYMKKAIKSAEGDKKKKGRQVVKEEPVRHF